MNHVPSERDDTDSDDDVNGNLRMTDEQLESGTTPSDAVKARQNGPRDDNGR
jgi:hypothetical protein